MKIILIVLTLLALVVTVTLGVAYTQRFNQDGKQTATSGIFFHKTLNLNAYKMVSSGTSMWGRYANYSRSDRHNETVTVYCNDYCKK